MFARRLLYPMFSKLATSMAKSMLNKTVLRRAGQLGLSKIVGSSKAKAKLKRLKQARKTIQANQLASIYEKKFFDAGAGDSTDVTTSGVYNYQSICKVAQGNGSNNRLGRRILIDTINVRGVINWPNQTDLVKMTGTVRIMVVWDKQANGAVPTVGTHLTNNDISDYNNLNYSDRFVTLGEKRITFNQPHAVLTGPVYSSPSQEQFIEFYIKCHIPVIFSSTAGALTELVSSNIFVYSVCDTNVTGVVDIASRIRFHDL